MNHPHEKQAAAMARAGELPDGEQLREYVNSGQVSAAQVVAHAENGELSMSMFASREDFDKAVAHQEAGDLRLQGSPFESKMAMALHAAFFDGWGACRDAEFVGDEAANDAFNQSATLSLCLSIDQNPVINHAAALAAERAEVARLRDAGALLANCAFNLSQMAGRVLSERDAKTLKFAQVQWDAALNPTQGATNHD